IQAFSARDAEAHEAFRARIARAALPANVSADPSAIAWLTSAAAVDSAGPSDHMAFRLSSIARILDDTFDNDLLKGIWAHGAVAGTGASPRAPGSGALLARSWALAGAAPDLGLRFVVGGQTALRAALLAQLKRYNNADVRFGAEVKEITAQRDVIQGVALVDGDVLRTPLVVSSLPPARSREMLTGFRRPPPLTPFAPSADANVAPALLKLTLGSLPKFPGLDPATLSAGAILRIEPSIARLTRAHGAFRERTLTTEPCLELRFSPGTAVGGKPRWDAFVAMTYLPIVTVDGPWAGNRRDRLRTLCVRTINAIVPSFGAAIEAAEILRPVESETVMDAKGPASLIAMASLDLTAVPEARAAAAGVLSKGITILEPSIYASAGEAGLLAAAGILGARARTAADA
ncbi:MAG: hypothetical protein K8S25_13305, partial [Alphaproteobacteria bacterium]|nr:hypothetical protein [Alphaproteobacteria bacterium]